MPGNTAIDHRHQILYAVSQLATLGVRVTYQGLRAHGVTGKEARVRILANQMLKEGLIPLADWDPEEYRPVTIPPALVAQAIRQDGKPESPGGASKNPRCHKQPGETNRVRSYQRFGVTVSEQEAAARERSAELVAEHDARMRRMRRKSRQEAAGR